MGVALRQLGTANTESTKSMEKLSSGYRINRAGDDAAGLSISEKMRGQIRGLNQASSNSQDAISLIQTAEGALSETHDILQRMRELAVQSASDTNVDTDRTEIQKEMNQLTSEINRIGNTTEFNTMKLVNGERAASQSVRSTQVIASKFADLSNMPGVKNDDKVKFKGDSLTIDTANTKLLNEGTLSIELNAEGELLVNIDSDGAAAFTSKDKITAENGVFKYNAHGVSFEIAEGDITEASSKIEMTFTTADIDAGTKVTKSDFTTNTVADATKDVATVTDFSVKPAVGSENIASMKVEWSGTEGAAGELTVTLMDAAGKVISTDVETEVTKGDAYEYNNHGVSFTFDPQDASAVEFTKPFETENVTKNISTEVDKSLAFQVGANQDQSMSLDISDMRAAALGISSAAGGEGFAANTDVTDGTDNAAVEHGLDVSSHTASAQSVTTINDAIQSVSSERSKLGAIQNRLEHTIKNLDTSAENLQSAEARIRDVDMAKEMMEQTKQSILSQAATAMLANANQSPQGVLQLLR